MGTININDGVEDIVYILANIGLTLGVIYFKYNSKNILLFLEELQNFDKFGCPAGFESLNKRVNRLTIYWVIFGSGAYLHHSFHRTFLADDCQKNNEKYHKSDICSLPGPLWLPFKIASNVKLIIGIMQTAYVISVIITCSLIAFVAGCTEFIIIRIEHLNLLLKDIFKSNNGVNCKDSLIKCIKYHIHIIS